MEEAVGHQPNPSVVDLKFTAVRVDLRRVLSRSHPGPRRQVLIISDHSTGLDVKRMVAEKVSTIDHGDAHRMLLVASVEQGDSRSKFIVPDDQLPLIICNNSPNCVVQFSLKWKKESNCPDHVTKSSAKALERHSGIEIGEENGFKMAASKTEEKSRRKHFGDAFGSARKSGRNFNECIIHYEPNDPPSITHHRPGKPKPLKNTPTFHDPHISVPVPQPTIMPTNDTSNGIMHPVRGSEKIQCDGGSRVVANISKTSTGDLSLGGAFSRTKDKLAELIEVVSSEISQSGIRYTKDPFPGGMVKRGGADGASFKDTRITSGSAKTSSQNSEQQRESKFSSLPNMEELQVRGDDRSGSENSLERAPSSNSLPCMNNDPEGGLIGGGRRCLPQLQVPEAIVEEKRSILSQKLEEKLLSFRKQKTKKTKKKRNSKPEVDSKFIRYPVGRSSSKTSEGDSFDDDDDSMSVTSWEVAEILATANPMAPKDSDYEEDPVSTSSTEEEDQQEDRLDSKSKSSRVSNPDSEADTLDGSDDEPEPTSNGSTKEFSPIRVERRTMEPPEHSKDLTTARVDPVPKPSPLSNQSGASSNTQGPFLSVSRTQHQKPSFSNIPSLFRMLNSGEFRFRTSVLSSRKSLTGRTVRLPFEVFNDVVYLDLHDQRSLTVPGKSVTVKEKFVLPVIGDSSDDVELWECLEGSLETGDVIVEVNGRVMLHESASAIVGTCLQFSDNIQLLLARRRITRR